MYNQDLALLITSPGLNYSRGDYDRNIDGIIPSVQYWIKPNLWISGWMYEYSIMKYLMPDGSSLEGIGIAPDIYKQNSKTTIDAGRDVVLEFAIEFLDTQTKK